MFAQIVVVNVHVFDEQVNRVIGSLEYAQPVFVLAFKQAVIDDSEVQSGRRVIKVGRFFCLLMDAAAVEDRKQMCELDRGKGAEWQIEAVGRCQVRTV